MRRKIGRDWSGSNFEVKKKGSELVALDCSLTWLLEITF